MRLPHSPRAALVAAVLCLVIAPATASAASKPPAGTYRCDHRSAAGNVPSGFFAIKSNGSYVAMTKFKGKYKVKGHKITFTSGIYKKYGWYGKYRPASSKAENTIFILDRADPDFKLHCYRDGE